MKEQHFNTYPNVITQLPQVELPYAGAKAWILQSDTRQMVFFEFQAGMELPGHSHAYPQWGMVIDGEMELTVDGKPRVCRGGDEYLVPAASTHSAKFLLKTRVMDFFSEKERYKPK